MKLDDMTEDMLSEYLGQFYQIAGGFNDNIKHLQLSYTDESEKEYANYFCIIQYIDGLRQLFLFKDDNSQNIYCSYYDNTWRWSSSFVAKQYIDIVNTLTGTSSVMLPYETYSSSN